MSKLFVVTVDLTYPTNYYEVPTETTTRLVGVFSTREKAEAAAREAEGKYSDYSDTYRVDDEFDWFNDVTEATARITETELDPDPEPETAPEEVYPEPTPHYGNRSKRFSKRERRAA